MTRHDIDGYYSPGGPTLDAFPSRALVAERWAPIPGWEGLYEVSDHGRVRSLPRVVKSNDAGGTRWWNGRVRKPTLYNNGYYYVALTGRGRRERFAIHRLVLLAFAGPCPPSHEALHGDGDRGNNRLSNLRWGTSKENAADRDRHGTARYRPRQSHCLRGHQLPETGPRACRECGNARARKKRRHENPGNYDSAGRPIRMGWRDAGAR